jgi:hypothetical protein
MAKTDTDTPATPETVTLVGTGTDPIGRYRAGETYTFSPEIAAEVMAHDWAVQPAPPRPELEAPELPEHEQHYDGRGRVVLDRQLTPTEAAAVDAHNRERYIRGRVDRFRNMQAPASPDSRVV